MCRSKQDGGQRCASHSPARRRLDRAATRIRGGHGPAQRAAVEELDPKYVYGTIAERAHAAETTTDEKTLMAAYNDRNRAVRDAAGGNPITVAAVKERKKEERVWRQRRARRDKKERIESEQRIADRNAAKKAADVEATTEDSETGTPSNANEENQDPENLPDTLEDERAQAARNDAIDAKNIAAWLEIEGSRVDALVEQMRDPNWKPANGNDYDDNDYDGNDTWDQARKKLGTPETDDIIRDYAWNEYKHVYPWQDETSYEFFAYQSACGKDLSLMQELGYDYTDYDGSEEYH